MVSAFGLSVNTYAAPDTTITVTNSFVNATTADATEVNANFGDVTTGFNSHSHLDLVSTTSNTFTIGDNGAGNKSLAVDTSFTTAPSIRYNFTQERFQFANNASTFVDFANLGTTITTIGDGTASNIDLAIDNAFTTSPSIRYNYTQERFQISNDGSTFADLVTSPSVFSGVSNRVARSAGNVTTTSTSLIDFTGATITLTTGSSPVLVSWAASCRNDTNGSSTFFVVDIDGTLEGGTSGFVVKHDTAGSEHPCSFTLLSPVLTAASHTVKIQWKVSANTGLTLCEAGTECILSVVEVDN